ncbi:hypothetical protein BX600DRAFT_450150 [Xylariales sp. PMI_506]|nr:hypothetical protein BX600DRAFT_450150 [Xylariales sp. PMI_506]
MVTRPSNPVARDCGSGHLLTAASPCGIACDRYHRINISSELTMYMPAQNMYLPQSLHRRTPSSV